MRCKFCMTKQGEMHSADCPALKEWKTRFNTLNGLDYDTEVIKPTWQKDALNYKFPEISEVESDMKVMI